MASVKHRVNKHANTQTHTYLHHLLSKGSFCMETENVRVSGVQRSSRNVCVCEWKFVYSGTQIQLSVLDVYINFNLNTLMNCVDVLSTTRRAAAIWRPVEPGPSRQNPRSARHNHIRQTPNELRRGPSQELTPKETVNLFKSQRQWYKHIKVRHQGADDRLWNIWQYSRADFINKTQIFNVYSSIIENK